MRIVGGKWRGRRLDAPEGRDVTRPTTDRTREQMASMVLSAFGLDLSEVSVLDAFAGSGAIGFELLSRGARSCTFVDADRKALARIRANARELGATTREYAVVTGDVFKLVARGALARAPFSLVVLDPPYALPAQQVSDLVQALRDSGQLDEHAHVLYERAAKAPGLELVNSAMLKSKAHGTTAVDLIVLGETDD